MPSGGHDAAPGGVRGLNAEAKEGQAGLEQDHQAEFAGGDNHQRTGDVGENMAEENTHGSAAGHFGGTDIGQGHYLERLRVGDAGVARPAGQAKNEHQCEETRPQHGDSEYGEQNGGDAQHGIDEAHDEDRRPAAEPAGEQAEHGADKQRDGDGEGGHHERGARAIKDAREQVSAEIVGAEQVADGRGGGAGRTQAHEQ